MTPDALPDNSGSLDLQEIRNMEDFNSQIEVLQSNSLIMAVSDRLAGDELERFMEPYENRLRFLGPLTPAEVLGGNRVIDPIRQSLSLTVSYSHPDPELAAQIANYFAQEFIDRNLRILVESSMDAVDALKVRTDQQRQEVERIEQELATYMRETKTISFNERSDIDHQELAQLNEGLTKLKIELDAARSRWNLVQEYREEGRYLWDLPFVAMMPQIRELLSERSSVNIEIATMSERYREKHPKMAEALQNLGQLEAELLAAVNSAIGKVRAEYENLTSTYDKTAERVHNKEGEILELADMRVAYDSLIRQREVAEVIHQGMLQQRMELEAAKANMKKPNVVIVDEAFPPIMPSSPNIPVASCYGLVRRVWLGCRLCFRIWSAG